MSQTASSLLTRLSAQKAVVSAKNGNLRVEAPKGVLNDQLRQDLRIHKPEILAFLHEQEQVLDMTLGEFAQSGLHVELRVPGYSQTLWWVATSRDAEKLMQGGIGRGRIWTAEELRRIWEGDIRDPNDVLPLISLKLHFNCVLQSLETPPFSSDGEPK